MAQQQSLTELQQELSIVNAAISEYVTGKRRKSLTIGSREFLRAYNFVALTWEELVNERNRLQNLINSLTPTAVTPTFRKNTNFPMQVTKLPV